MDPRVRPVYTGRAEWAGVDGLERDTGPTAGSLDGGRDRLAWRERGVDADSISPRCCDARRDGRSPSGAVGRDRYSRDRRDLARSSDGGDPQTSATARSGCPLASRPLIPPRLSFSTFDARP